MHLKFKSVIGKLPYLNMFYLAISEATVKKVGGTGKIRLICTVNGKVEFPCGLMAMKNGTAYISINKKRMKEAGATAGDTVQVELKEDKSKYGMPMPEELNEVLLSDPEGKERFEKLTPVKQRNIIHFVSSVKSSQLKIDRALKLINNLKLLPPGKEKVREIFFGPGE